MDQLIKKLQGMPGKLNAAMQRAALQTAITAQKSAQKKAPVGKFSQAGGSGGVSLRSGIHAKAEHKGNTAIGIVESTAPHSIYVEYGTGKVGAGNSAGTSPNVRVAHSQGPWKHPKNPKPGYRQIQTDYWVYPAGNGKFYATRGQKARPFLYPAAKENEQTFETVTRKELIKALKGGG
jgi:HK97 gp10 family phage protein